MPCNTMRTVTQKLNGIEDETLLMRGLEDMGFTTSQQGRTIYFSGHYKNDYQSGSYSNGKLRSDNGLDLTTLRKYIAMANLKKNADDHGWDIEPIGGNPFEMDIKKTKDAIHAEVLNDGTIKLTKEGHISAPNHINAEQLVAAIEHDAGHEAEVHHLKHHHEHNHHHEHLHL